MSMYVLVTKLLQFIIVNSTYVQSRLIFFQVFVKYMLLVIKKQSNIESHEELQVELKTLYFVYFLLLFSFLYLFLL